MAQKIEKDTKVGQEVVENTAVDFLSELVKLDHQYVISKTMELRDVKEAATKLRSLYGLATPEPILVAIQILQNQKLQDTMEKILECLQENKK